MKKKFCSFKKTISLVTLFMIVIQISVSAAINNLATSNSSAFENVDWASLYKTKTQQIENEYKQGKREKDSIYDTMFFSLQDIDFNGIPELYHALISTDKGDYEIQEGSEEIYYIKNGKVVLGKIVSKDSLGLLPPYLSTNSYNDRRWQYALYHVNEDEVQFVTKDSWVGNATVGEVSISKLQFDPEKGTLTSSPLIKGEYTRANEPGQMEGYQMVGAASYYSVSRSKDKDIWSWEAPYINSEYIEIKSAAQTTIATKSKEWSEAYKSFVLDKKYAKGKQKYYTENVTNIVFALHDLDGDDIPELIIKNGAKKEDDMQNYVYTYSNKNVKFIDNIGSRNAEFKYIPLADYKGLCWASGNSGYYPGYYYSMKNGKIEQELVVEEKVEYINSKMEFIKSRVTDDDALYEAYKEAQPLQMYSIGQINSFGWDHFIDLCSETDSALFLDITRSSWCYDAVKYVHDKKLMSGISKTLFDPDSELTRAMFVTMLYRMEKEPTTKAVKYKDVEKGSWYENAISWASQKNIVSGVETNYFAPEDNITREQLVTILYRYAKFKNKSINAEKYRIKCFVDNKDVSAYAVDAMNWSIENGLMSGTSEQYLTPEGVATRAQAAVILQRFCEKFNF